MELTASGPRKAALIFIFITVALDMLAIGLIVPVLPKLVVGFSANQAQGARIFGLFGTVWAFMQFIAAPALGALSDRVGRRPVVLVSNFGLGFDYILMAMAPSLSWLFVGRVISGISAASVPTATAYIADVTPPDKRASAFGMIGAAFGIGFVFGPGVGGWLGSINERLPFWVAAGLSLANACYGLFVLPESLSKDRRTPFSWKKANPVAALALLRSHHELFGLAAVNFLAYLAHESLPSIYVLYAGYRYGWGPFEVGTALATVGICTSVVQAALTKRIVGKLGDRGAVLFGTLIGCVGFALMGFATNGWTFWASIPFISLWGVASPAIMSIMSHRVAGTEQGRLQGALSSMRGVTGMIGPALFTFTYAAFIKGGAMTERGLHIPGAAYFLAAILLGTGWLTAWKVTRGLGSGDTAPPPARPVDFVSETA